MGIMQGDAQLEIRTQRASSADALSLQIRGACEHLDRLINSPNSTRNSEPLAKAYEDLFVLLEELRFVEKELRLNNRELLSAREIMELEHRRYEELLKLAPDGYLITDEQAAIHKWNPRAAEILGMELQDLSGLTLLLFATDEHLSPLREKIRQAQSGDIVRGFEMKLRPRKGPVTYVTLTMGTIRDADQRPTGLHWLLRDITVQKRTEEALRLSEDRFRYLSETVKDAIILADDTGCITSWNPAAVEILGYSESEVLGEPLTSILPPEIREYFLKALRRENPFVGRTLETQVARADSSIFFAEITLSAWTSGSTTTYSVLCSDISERKQAEEIRVKFFERVLSAQEEDRRWIARELHDETGQSLAFLLVGLRMIEDSRSLKQARMEANRLRKITSQTLDDVGRLAKGLHPIVLDDLGLVVALDRHAQEFERAFGIPVRFETRGLAGNRLPLAVETALFRIAQEALTNSIKHAAPTKVYLTLERDEKGIQLIVQDNGCGFSLQAVLHSPTNTNHLGLYGMKERATLLGGSVTIESRISMGTKISARVPCEVFANALPENPSLDNT